MRYLPTFLEVRGQPCLIVGGGEVALRKAQTLDRAGAQVSVVAPDCLPPLQSLALRSGGRLTERRYRSSDLRGMRLVVGATDDRTANATIAADALAGGLLVNTVDDPANCNFVMPSIVDRDPVLVAISSSGTAPVLARLLRGRIEALLPQGLGRVAAVAGELRARVKSQLSEPGARRAFWEGVLTSSLIEGAQASSDVELRTGLEAALARAGTRPPAGVCYVGVGPGDPDLLTLRAQRLMQQADVVLHAGVATAIVDRCRRDAQVVELADLGPALITALTPLLGKRVCVLAMGDPFVDPQSLPAIELLRNAAVPVQTARGVSAR